MAAGASIRSEGSSVADDQNTPRIGERGPAVLPMARGPISRAVIDALRQPAHRDDVLRVMPSCAGDPLADEDLQLALYVSYELHYRGWAGVEPGWEWDPRLLALRHRLEEAFRGALRAEVGLSDPACPPGPAATADALRRLVEDGDGRSLSSYVEQQACIDQLREFAIHRSLYQLKEADPHTWSIPRLPPSRGKAALLRLQFDEYGDAVPGRSHAELFADTLRALDLDDRYGAYLDVVPGVTMATVNLLSMFGLHRELVGACIGHLAVFEMTSVVPMDRYARAIRRLTGSGAGAEFYDVHVVADAKHQQIAVDHLVPGIVEAQPGLGGDVLFGARALMAVERRFTQHLLDRWDCGRTSLRPFSPSLDLAS
jgi:hypothetical protein